MTYSLHPGDEHDIAKVLDFYSEQVGAVVAEHFPEEFERAPSAQKTRLRW